MVSKKSGHLYEKRLILKVIKVSRAFDRMATFSVRARASGPPWGLPHLRWRQAGAAAAVPNLSSAALLTAGRGPLM